MKKMIIALVLLIPLIFMFTVFSVVQVSSLQVNVPVNGIEIKDKEPTMYVDMASYNNDKKFNVNVFPLNASNKKYSFVVGDEKVATVTKDGVLIAKSLGSTKITIVSNDGGFKDSVNVVVESSSVLDLRLGMYDIADENHKNNLIETNGENYLSNVAVGKYSYEASPIPLKESKVEINVISGNVIVDKTTKTMAFLSKGESVIEFVVRDKKTVTKRLTVNASPIKVDSPILINGEANHTFLIDKVTFTSKSIVYSPNGEPVIKDNPEIKSWKITPKEEGLYDLDITYNDTGVDEFNVVVSADEKEQTFPAKKIPFDFVVKTDLVKQTGNKVTAVLGDEVTFYASSVTNPSDITYEWQAIGGNQTIENIRNGAIKVKAKTKQMFVLICKATYNGTKVLEKTVNVTVVGRASSVAFNDDDGNGLLGLNAIGDTQFVDMKLARLDYYFDVSLKNIGGENPELKDFNITGSNNSIAETTIEGGRLKLRIKRTGEVTIKAEWKGNQNYGTNICAKYTFVAVKGGVEVYNYDQLKKATDSQKPVVLRRNINLGTKEDNKTPYSIEERKGRIYTMPSTYNTDYVKATGGSNAVKYAIEFKNNVYGNGYMINAEHIAKAEDSTGKPLIFTGSLPLVGYYLNQNQLMKISGQDNISFLIRTDGVTLSNVTLAGCFDESLVEGDKVELNRLNNVGTVLEINADCKVLNCRIKNGKTAVRVFGGNREGQNFFVPSLDGNDIAEADRIKVEINGSVISVAREFLIKTGSNRALRSCKINGDEPNLLDAGGKPYKTNDYNLNDEYFYNKYVMTDLTLKNSVLENSGLFALGMESNFSGPVLNGDNLLDAGLEEFAKNWKIGDTMFASAIRLEGDVRFYDWKSVNNMDSSQLVEVFAGGKFDRFKLDIKKMIESVVDIAHSKGDNSYDDIFTIENNEKFLSSAMVKYGGGKNYANIDLSKLDTRYKDFTRYDVNIGILKETNDKDLQDQGTYLPLAAGTQDFNFFLYSNSSEKSLYKQLDDHETGVAYSGVLPVKIA